MPEQGAENYGLHWDGARRVPLGGGWMAMLQAGTATASISYRGPDGLPRAAPPAQVKASAAARLAALRAEAKKVRAAIARERALADGLLAERRSWDLADWRRRYLEHPLTGRLARGLIWEFRRGQETVVTGIPQDGPAAYDRWLLTSDGGVAPLPDDGAARLWHPACAGPDEVRAWRDLVVGWQLPQPVRQAFREVYEPDAADLTAPDHSARLAGHVFRQREARALMKGRGWTAVPASAWEDGVARREFTAAGLQAELSFDPASDDVGDAGLYDYVVSGQVRFVGLASAATVPLAQVPPLVFTEAMRDGDLFLRATSIGADPDWLDRGGAHRFGSVYWHRFGFGEPGASAGIRREALQRLLPGLAIADRCTVTDRFLHVDGAERAYRIHLGSGHVLTSPGDQYLRISAARHPRAAAVVLPFDDDPVLAAIVARAFLLAAGGS